MLKKYIKPEAEMKSFALIDELASNLDSWTQGRGTGLGLNSDAGEFTTSYKMSSMMQN